MIEDIKDIFKSYEAKAIGRQRKYAVLLPLVEVNGEWHILYEVRSSVVSQPGETSFPGGGVEEGETYKEAAIRETMEELNVPRSSIYVIGEMDYILTQSHIIHCFVAHLHIEGIHTIKPNKEVDEVFTVPLSFLKANPPEYHGVNTKTVHDDQFPFDLISSGEKYKWIDRKHFVPFYRLPNYFLWGFTADFTHRFIDIIDKQNEKKKGSFK